MIRIFILLVFFTSQLYAEGIEEIPYDTVFMQPDVMSENHANFLISYTIEKEFWGKAKLFNGKTIIEPINDEDKNKLPIPRKDALHLVSVGSFAGQMAHCGLDALKFIQYGIKPFWGRYNEERQIVLGVTLLRVTSEDVQFRLKNKPCTKENKEALESAFNYVLQ